MASYVRVAIQGTALGGEVWSINPVFDPANELPGGVNQANLDAACQAIANLSPGTMNQTVMSSALTLTGARLEVRDQGTDNLIGISVQGRTTPLVGGSSPKMPMQAAGVISLRTNTPGASGRGRLYWPILGAALEPTTRIPTETRDSILSDFKTWLNGMKDALEDNFSTISFDLAVRSRTTSSTPHVTRLQMGNVVDTQRRRRDKLVEAYGSVAYP